MSRLFLLFAPVLLLSACAPKSVAISVPPAERFQPVLEPKVPEGSTDADVAGYLIALVKALRESNAKLAWLGDWAEGVTE